MTPRIGSLCSGYGGLDLGLMAVVGGSVAWHVEYDKHPSAVLAARFPGVPNYGDVTKTDWSTVEPVDWLTAGYPCQPFSGNGNREGEDDPRHLWPHVFRAICVLRPRHVLLENVDDHLTLGFGAVLGDLASAGFDAEWCLLRASDVGAPHGRPRLFVVATDARRNLHDAARHRGVEGTPAQVRPLASAERQPRDGRGDDEDEAAAHTGGSGFGPYADAIRRWERVLGRPAPAPVLTRADDTPDLNPVFAEWVMGLPQGWVTDAPIPVTAQNKALGNGVVPQQAELAVRLLLPADSALAEVS
jgi:DNA (cytosine-5)-methyltransferase 1